MSAPRRRDRTPAWGAAFAVGSLVAAAAAVTALVLFDARGPGEAWRRPFALFLALAALATCSAAVTAFVLSRSGRVGARQLPSLLIGFWRDRASGWTMFLLGSLLTLPAFGLYTRTLVGDSDSARLIASILYVQRNGIDYLVETQEVLLPHLVLGPILALGGIPAVQAFDASSVVLLGGVVSLITWRLTRSPLAAAGAALALVSLPEILERAYLVPMYPTMLAFGLLGVYLARRAIVAENRASRWRYAVLAGLCLVLSFEAHQVGQLFLVVTALLVVTARPRAALRGLGPVYLAVLLFSIPRLVINLAEGGFSHLASNRVDFWFTKGYLQPLQVEIFDLPVRDPLGEYLAKAPGRMLEIWHSPGLLVIALSVVGLLAMSSRLRRFAVACVCVFLAVAVYRRLPFYPRYFSLLLVGTALAAGIAFTARRRLGSRSGHAAVALVLAGLVVCAGFSYRAAVEELQAAEARLAGGPYLRLAKEVPPGEGVFGTRSMYLNFASTDARVFGDQFLTEDEYVTFLTWPSDDAVVDLMQRHDAAWIFVPNRPGRWVGRYNDVWLLPNYGKPATYHVEVAQSPSFCLVRRIRGAALYRLVPPDARDAVGAGGPRRCDDL